MASFTKRNGRLSTSRTYAANFEIMAQARLCCTLMFGPGQSLLRAARWWLASALVIVAILALPFAAAADDRPNLLLKNLGWLSFVRDAVYYHFAGLSYGVAARSALPNPNSPAC